MLFEVYALTDKDGIETFSTNAVSKLYQKLVSAILILYGKVLIWQARDDLINMHVLAFEKDDVKKVDSVYRVSFVFWWVIRRGKCYIDGPNDGYPVEYETLG
jgi:outer membrane protein assembly factor BamB